MRAYSVKGIDSQRVEVTYKIIDREGDTLKEPKVVSYYTPEGYNQNIYEESKGKGGRRGFVICYRMKSVGLELQCGFVLKKTLERHLRQWAYDNQKLIKAVKDTL